jgi:hypothetical protein
MVNSGPDWAGATARLGGIVLFLPSDPDIGKRMDVEDPEYGEEPQNYGHDDDAIENGLNARLHGDEAVHQPEQESYDHERNDDVDQHTKFSLRGARIDRDR